MLKNALHAAWILALVTACAGMTGSWRAANCNYDGAYKAGMNDARRGEEMNPRFSNACESPTRPEAERGYREGYTAGVGAARVYLATPPPAPGPEWKCVEAYGKKACGYHCVEDYGKVACSGRPDHNCVAAYGKVRCGPRCRDEYGKIVCDGD